MPSKIYVIKQKGEELYVDLAGSKPVLRPIQGGVLLYDSPPLAEDVSYFSASLDEELEVLELLPCSTA
jgi:hypothetical protein